jgi:hypothetical protein
VLLLKIWDSIQIPNVVGYEATFKYSKSISSKESPGWSKLLSSDTYIWLTAVASNYSQKASAVVQPKQAGCGDKVAEGENSNGNRA